MAIIKTQGTVLRLGANIIGQVVSISGISSGSASEIDTVNLASTSREVILGLKDNGEIAISLQYDPDNGEHNSIRFARNSGAINAFSITLTDAGTELISFSAYVKTYDINIAQDDKVTLDVTLRVQGAITHT